MLVGLGIDPDLGEHGLGGRGVGGDEVVAGGVAVATAASSLAVEADVQFRGFAQARGNPVHARICLAHVLRDEHHIEVLHQPERDDDRHEWAAALEYLARIARVEREPEARPVRGQPEDQPARRAERQPGHRAAQPEAERHQRNHPGQHEDGARQVHHHVRGRAALQTEDVRHDPPHGAEPAGRRRPDNRSAMPRVADQVPRQARGRQAHGERGEYGEHEREHERGAECSALVARPGPVVASREVRVGVA